jgi:pimeloyl-ACP methyl ester carboxylesterase
MIWLILLFALVLLVALLPWLIERGRRPLTERERDRAPGRFVDLPAGRTHYLWHGGGGTRTLVLIHGLSTPSWVFCGLTRGLTAAGFRVLSYDLYGRGFSDRPGGKQTLAFHVAQLAALLEALDVDEPVTLMGYSMGAAIAARFAAENPDRVERLILLAPAGIVYRPGKLIGMAGRNRLIGGWLWGLFGGRALRQSARREAHKPTIIPDLAERIGRELRLRGYLAAILSSERHALGEQLEAAHREIAAMYIPTLAIWGEADPVIPVAAMGELARWHRHAHQETVAGAGHGLVYTHPQEVLAAIRAFLHDIPE